MPEIVAIIPARGGSKTIPRKNIKLLGGKPMIYYTIREALKSKYLNRVVVSTEDREIAQVAVQFGAEIIQRPDELAGDDAPSSPVFQHTIDYLERLENYHHIRVVILQPTSPLRVVDDIDGAIQKFLEVDCDSVVSVCEVEYPLGWMYTLDGDRLKPIVEGGGRITRWQDTLKGYRLNGAVYVAKRELVMSQGGIISESTRAYIIPRERSVDINTELDLKLAELLMGERT